MTNSDIIDTLELAAKLLELHEADAFKIRAYGTAAFQLDKLNGPVIAELSYADLIKLPGVGKGVAAKIRELIETGQIAELEALREATPIGLFDLFRIKGIGAKKIAVLWKELGIENLHALEIACQNGHVEQLKGFGKAIQQKILDSMAFLRQQEGKLRMNQAEELGLWLLDQLQGTFERVALTGQLLRKTETVDSIQLVVAGAAPVETQKNLNALPFLEQNRAASSPFVWRGNVLEQRIAIEIVWSSVANFENECFVLSATEAHLAQPLENNQTLYQHAKQTPYASDSVLYAAAGLPYIVPEMREGRHEWQWAKQHQPEDLVRWESLRGILHNHSTYSDGSHSLAQMAERCRALGFEYFGIADHSQTATYASGLRPEAVRQQQAEIDQLNAHYAKLDPERPFFILKGIESDILNDGALDYPDELLASFDYVVASVHSTLNMSEEKATQRLLRAIANPYTTLLGHPTGRLLLSREGYPLDHRAIIDACAAYGVVMELNASPWRLDLDWRWIDYCMEKGVMISINPDAHAMEGFEDMRYGVSVARKGGLTAAMTFNALPGEQVRSYLAERKKRIKQ